jgi:hypothetical protein
MVLNRVLAGEWRLEQAALTLGLSERQVRRLRGGYQQAGPAALVHGNRGRQPVHALPLAVRERVVALARGKYAGFNHQHLTEKLGEVEQLVLGRTTVRQILLQAGLRSPRARRAPKHRSRRERMAQAGMLLQADGSQHRWLGPDAPPLALIGGVDDATGQVPWALFRAQEDAQGYLLWLREVARTVGLPLALYIDRHGIFKKSSREPLSLEEELAGRALPTQVGRALAELAIEPIFALSPQAKGRIERLWGTFQDRLVNELRLAGVQSLEAANQFLREWLPRFNARFAVPAAAPDSAYRPWPADLDPEQVFCFKYTRTVAADNTVQFARQVLQLQPDPQRASYARVTIEVHERLDGSLAVFFRGRCLGFRPAPPSAPVLRARAGPRVPAPPRPTAPPAAIPTSAPAAGTSPLPRRPGPRHPWRHPWKQKNEPAAHTDGLLVLPSQDATLPAAPVGVQPAQR